MKSNTFKMLIALSLAVAMCLSLFACNSYDSMTASETDEFYLTKEPDAASLEELSEISDSFLAFLTNSDPAEIRDHLDPSTGITDEQLTAFLGNYSQANPFTVYDSYYINNVKPEDVTRKFKKSADDEFGVEITPGSSEMYMVLFASENEKISHMVSMLCAKDKEWQIVWIDASDFKYNGKDAQELFEETSELYEKGSFIEAYAVSLKLNLVMRPGNTLVHNSYTNMEDLFYKLQAEFQKEYPTPYTPEGSDAKLLAIALAKEEGEIVPLLIVQSDSDLSDTDTLKVQAKKLIDKISPDFTDYFDTVSVSVYNVDPNTAESEPEAAHFVL